MSDKVVPTIATILFLVVVFGAMVLAWRARRRRSAPVVRPVLAADEIGSSIDDAEAFYVATTRFEQPLERLALPGLEFRARARVRVFDNAIILEIPGESPTMVPAESLRAVGTTNVTIDRVVESDGLIVLSWLFSADTVVDSYFRIVDPGVRARAIASISSIIPTSSPTNATTQREV